VLKCVEGCSRVQRFSTPLVNATQHHSIRAGYEKYAQINPDATGFRYTYASYACRCRQWQDFLDQVKIIRKNDSEPNYNYFGGKEEFDKLVALANQQIANLTPNAWHQAAATLKVC
jgi:hypothetical protein